MRMLSRSSVLKRLLKVGVVVICVSGFLFQTSEFLELYWTYPTVVDIQVSIPSEIDFPAISICNTNGINPIAVCTLGGFCTKPQPENFSSVCDTFKGICLDGGPPLDFKVVNYQRNFVEHALNTSYLNKLRVPLKEYFGCKIKSSSGERECNTESAMIGSYYSEDGIPNFCYTLYSHWGNPKAEIQKIKKSERIELEIYIDCSFRNRSADLSLVQHPVYNCIGSPSIQMAIHSRYMAVSPFVAGSGFFGGKKYSVKIKQDEKHLLPPPYQTNCTDYMTNWVARGGVGPLTQLMALEECKFNASLKQLGCVPFFIDYPHNQTVCKYCENCPEVTGIGNDCSELIRDYNQPCDLIKYDVEVEEKLVDIKSRIQNMFIVKKEYIIVKESGYNCTDDKAYTKRCQIIEIEIAFNDFEISNVTYNAKFESMELFSVIGGYMGMYLGISIVAVYDFAEALAWRFYLFLKKRRRERKKLNREKNSWRQERFHYPKSMAKSESRYSGSFRKRFVQSFSPRDIY